MKIPQKVLDICALLDDKKANDILICDTTKLNNVADYFILATGDSPAHLNGISDYIMSKAQENQPYYEFVGKEGFILSQWIVLDFDRVLVHLFVKEEREKYSLAKLLNEGRNQISYKKLQNNMEVQQKRQEMQQKKELENQNKQAKIKEKKEVEYLVLEKEKIEKAKLDKERKQEKLQNKQKHKQEKEENKKKKQKEKQKKILKDNKEKNNIKENKNDTFSTTVESNSIGEKEINGTKLKDKKVKK